jgi:hypothetical protein
MTATVRIDWAMLCNAAERPPGGLLYILGGGIDTFRGPEFPTRFTAALVVRLLAAPSETGTRHSLEIRLVPEGESRELPGPIVVSVGPLAVPTDLPAGWDMTANVLTSLQGLRIPRAGLYRIDILLDGEHARSVPFRAVDTLATGQ